MGMELTQWHDISIDPVHFGVYELKDSEFPYSYWCGVEFHGAFSSVEKALKHKNYTDNTRLSGCAFDATGWRGLCTKP